MIRHIVLWKLDDSYSTEEKTTIKKELQSKFLNLPGKIKELKYIEVNFNSEEAPEANYDIVLDTKFETFSELNSYQIHPEHKKIGSYLKDLKIQRSCIDYQN